MYDEDDYNPLLSANYDDGELIDREYDKWKYEQDEWRYNDER